MARRVLTKWSLKREPYPKTVKGHCPMQDGTPILVPLELQLQDEAFRGHEYFQCCDCGLQHLFTFEVFHDKGRLSLQIRPYRTGKRGRTNG